MPVAVPPRSRPVGSACDTRPRITRVPAILHRCIAHDVRNAMRRTVLRTALAAATTTLALTVPASPAVADPSGSPFRIQNVKVSVDPADPYHPIVTYRLKCNLPKQQRALRSGQTHDTWVYLDQSRPDRSAWWHLHGPFEVPRAYVCNERVTFKLFTEIPGGGTPVSTGSAKVTIRETITVNGAHVTERYEEPVDVRTARP